MAYKTNETLSFEELTSKLVELCANGDTGELSLFTDKRHAAVISLNDGDIVELRYRISRGNEALRFIKDIKNARIRFVEGVKTYKENMIKLPPTPQILSILGAKFDAGLFNKIGKTILVVEDSRTQRKSICRMLLDSGYDVIEAEDGLEALAVIDNNKLDMILLDIIMPGIDGYKLAKIIKERQDMDNVFITMLTSRDSLIDKVRGRVSGVDEYLTKPFKKQVLIDRVNKYLHRDKQTMVRNAYAFAYHSGESLYEAKAIVNI